MTIIDSLRTEFAHEAATTRKHLERLPNDKLDWRPHEKSFTVGALASHIVECVGWADSIFNQDELDFDPTTFTPYVATSVANLLETYDRNVVTGSHALANATDARAAQLWRMKVMGKIRLEKSRTDALRDFTLSHLIHHRGQLTVYLRLLDVPVPGSYGPTADEHA